MCIAVTTLAIHVVAPVGRRACMPSHWTGADPHFPPAMVDVSHELANVDAAVASGKGHDAVRLVREAQSLAPRDPDVAVRLMEACLLDNQLMCAAHGARSLLRHAAAEADNPTLCRYLGAAKAFGARARRLRWCRKGEPCDRLGNTSAAVGGTSFVVGSLPTRDDGQLWSAEHMVGALKEVLEDDSQWRGASGSSALNHAAMQHMQGNPEVARDMYERVLKNPKSDQHASDAAMRAYAYTNLGILDRASPAARQHFEDAIKIAPDAAEAGERWLELARVHWQRAELPSARHSLRRALTLRPESAFAHALAAELHARRHDYGRAATAAARADGLQMARAPQLPECARWSQLLPRLPHLWGDARHISDMPAESRGPPQIRLAAHERRELSEEEDPTPAPAASAAPQPLASAAYRELLVGCRRSHTKRTGGGWHQEALRWQRPGVDVVAALSRLEERSMDEVHWCTSTIAADGEETGDKNTTPAPLLDEKGWRAVWRTMRPSGLLQVVAGNEPPSELTSSGPGALFQALDLPPAATPDQVVSVAVEAAGGATAEIDRRVVFQRVG